MNTRACSFAPVWLALLASLSCLAAAAAGAAPRMAPAVAWSQSTDLPECRDGYAAGFIDGQLYVVGGVFWDGTSGAWKQKVFSGTTHRFDPRTQVWTKLADTPVTLGYPASAQVGREIFILGGNQNGAPGRQVYVFRPSGDGFAWEQHSELPETRLFASAVAIGTKVYVVGGARDYEPFDAKGHCCTSKTTTNTLWVLDTTDPTRAWKPLADYPGEARWLQAAEAVGTDLYVFGGISQLARDEPVKQFNDVLKYDTVAGTWSRVGPMPAEMQSATAVTVHGQVLLVSVKQNVMRFDPATGAFSPMDPLPRDAMVTKFVWADPLLIGAGGENSEDGARRRSPWTFIGRPNAAFLRGSAK